MIDVNATTAPIERSMPPMMITSRAPTAITPMLATCPITFSRLLTVRK